MKRLPTLFLLTLGILHPQDNFQVNTIQVTDHIYQLNIDAGGMEVNTVVFLGKDGFLLVDTGLKQTVEVFREALDALEAGAPKIIINTHAHSDHTGGNALFGKEPIIIAHEIVRNRVRSGNYVLFEYPDEALPDISFKDTLTVFFNDEEIRLIAIPGSHDDNDIIVWFTKSNVVYLGDLIYTSLFPSVDGLTGNAAKYADAVGAAITLLPEDIQIIPGHGKLCTMTELKTYHEMLVQTTAIVRKGYLQGKSLKTLQQEHVLNQWDSYSYDLYVTTNDWIQYLYTAIQGKKPLKPLVEPLYYALQGHDAKYAINKYFELKKNRHEEYKFSPGTFYYLGVNYLIEKERYADAIALLKLSLVEFPDFHLNWAFYDAIASAYMESGNKQLAIANYEKSLTLYPENTNAAEMLKILREK